MPRASVIIPTHNRCETLLAAIESARAACEDVEIVVVDDASTDATQRVCRAIDGIRYERLERNHGPAGTRNVGLQLSTSEYVAFLDDDDTLLPGSIDEGIALLERNPDAAFVYGRVHLHDGSSVPTDGRVRPVSCPAGDVYWWVLTGNRIYINAVVARRRRLLEVGGFDPRLPALEDWDLWIKVCEKYPVVSHPATVATVRVSTVFSGQNTSNRPLLAAVGSFVQARGLTLAKGQAASAARRWLVRNYYLTRASGFIAYLAALALAKGALGVAATLFLTALKLRCSPASLRRVWEYPTLAVARDHAP